VAYPRPPIERPSEQPGPPRISVVVPSHGRPERLRTLLDALAAQVLDREQWEVVVVHTYHSDVASELLDGHELGRDGVLVEVRLPAAEARASRQRNAGWRRARGELVVFTDDDCRPTPEWLERLLAASRAHPGKIVQGATVPDPREEHLFARPHIRTVKADPPSREVETCNVLYERPLLERLGGFDERAITGEDTELALRARQAGADVIGVPQAVTYHAIYALSLLDKIRSQHRWQHLAYVVKRHPELRQGCKWRVWWKGEHYGAALALIALAMSRRHRAALVGLLPYIQIERWRHGAGRREQLRALRELPAHWVVELAEIGSFVRGSVRYRTILL
jgi:glycosyltransferase involved in cell wall biosynthesis